MQLSNERPATSWLIAVGEQPVDGSGDMALSRHRRGIVVSGLESEDEVAGVKVPVLIPVAFGPS